MPGLRSLVLERPAERADQANRFTAAPRPMANRQF